MSTIKRWLLAGLAATLLALVSAPLALADDPTNDGAWGSGTSGDNTSCNAPSR